MLLDIGEEKTTTFIFCCFTAAWVQLTFPKNVFPKVAMHKVHPSEGRKGSKRQAVKVSGGHCRDVLM